MAAIPINFNTYHPQGMVKIGDTFFLSTVDIRKPTTRYPQLQDGYDRDTGEGAGHLIKLWTESGLPMTYNPFWIEATTNGLRAYFMPEDEKSTLYVYEAEVK